MPMSKSSTHNTAMAAVIHASSANISLLKAHPLTHFSMWLCKSRLFIYFSRKHLLGKSRFTREIRGRCGQPAHSSVLWISVQGRDADANCLISRRPSPGVSAHATYKGRTNQGCLGERGRCCACWRGRKRLGWSGETSACSSQRRRFGPVNVPVLLSPLRIF